MLLLDAALSDEKRQRRARIADIMAGHHLGDSGKALLKQLED